MFKYLVLAAIVFLLFRSQISINIGGPKPKRPDVDPKKPSKVAGDYTDYEELK
jgi:hypothetical protein